MAANELLSYGVGRFSKARTVQDYSNRLRVRCYLIKLYHYLLTENMDVADALHNRSNRTGLMEWKREHRRCERLANFISHCSAT